MRGKNKTRRLKLKRSKLHSLKLRKRRKTKKRGGAGKLKTVSEENASGVRKRGPAKSPRKPSKNLSQVKPSSVKKAKKLYSPVILEDAWL